MEAGHRLSIRRAVRDDLAAIMRIEKVSFGSDAWERESFRDYLSNPENIIFLIAVRSKILGGYAVGVYNENRAELDSIAVGPSHRGRGIASALMNGLIKILQRRAISTISLMVRLDNAAAIALYRKLGFRRERRINGYYEDGAPGWRMRISL